MLSCVPGMLYHQTETVWWGDRADFSFSFLPYFDYISPYMFGPVDILLLLLRPLIEKKPSDSEDFKGPPPPPSYYLSLPCSAGGGGGILFVKVA